MPPLSISFPETPVRSVGIVYSSADGNYIYAIMSGLKKHKDRFKIFFYQDLYKNWKYHFSVNQKSFRTEYYFGPWNKVPLYINNSNEYENCKVLIYVRYSHSHQHINLCANHQNLYGLEGKGSSFDEFQHNQGSTKKIVDHWIWIKKIMIQIKKRITTSMIWSRKWSIDPMMLIICRPLSMTLNSRCS